jgi:F-type H+-transporting ATPase subunit b
VSALGINIPGLIAEIINFIVLLTILYLVLYKPVTRMLDQRSKKIQESLEQAERLKQDTARAEDEVKKQIEAARLEGRNLVAQATQVSDRLRADAQTQAKVEADAIIARARESIQRERDEAIEQLRAQFADLTIVAAERVIKTSLNAEQHRRLIEEVLEQSSSFRRN